MERNDSVEDLGARIADCLEAHLHEFGWEPYRYPPGLGHPEGEHKGVEFDRATGIVTLIDAEHAVTTLRLERADPLPGERP